VLHVGSGKTGTSSIQGFLQRNRAGLRELGLLYPRAPGRSRHYRLNLFAHPDAVLDGLPTWRKERERFSSPEEFRKVFRRRLFREINQSGLSRVLLSDEALYNSPDQAMQRLSRLARRIASNRRLVVYLRRQDDHLVSRYQQVVKKGETRRLAERTQQLDLSETYNHYTRLRKWERLLEPNEFVIRRFEPHSFVGGSLYQDFLEAAGIDARAEELKQLPAPRNESLDAESVEFVRILNIFRVENEAAAALVPVDRTLVKRLAAASTGPTLTMPGRVLDDFMSQWEDSNERAAREILGDESGKLFHKPRKTHNTTTEQRLEPARLDHFLTLAQLPEQVHAPLRVLAEREVKAGR
jgi:hypothetical protein